MSPQPAEQPQSSVAGDDDASLQQLSDAFAEMLKSDDNGASAGGNDADAAAATEDLPTGGPSDPLAAMASSEDADQPPVTPKGILEAMLFVGHPDNEPLTARQAAAVINGVSPREVEALIGELQEEYDAADYTYEIVSAAAGYRLVLRDQYLRVRNRFYGRIREATLSQAAIDVLALVAYNQPITNEQVSQRRGHPSGSILAQLVRRQLLRMERPETKPRTPVYFTTPRFLKLFGLESLDELPKSQELET